MKKKMVMSLLTVMITASMIAGCNKTTDSAPAVEAESVEDNETETEPVIEEEEEEPVQEISYLLSITAVNEDGSYAACDAEAADYILTLSDSFPEEQKDLLVVEGAVTVTAPEGQEEDTQEGKKLTITSAAAAEDTEEALAVKREAFKKINGFSVDDSIVASMYAKQAVNVRKGPSTDYEKLGGLSFAQEVSVTGQADNGWYQIDFDGEKGYVSNSYIVSEKPVAKAAASSGVSGGVASTGGSSSSADSFYVVYSEAEMMDALNSGDINKYWEMQRANTAASMGGGETGAASSGGSSSGGDSSTSTEKSTSTSTAFVDYLNSQRAAAGLSTLAWSDSMATTAVERAEEIVSDFSHNGMRDCYAEIITQSNSSDVSSWFSNFYNSPAHKMDMMDDGLYTQCAAAVTKSGSKYYVVVMFK